MLSWEIDVQVLFDNIEHGHDQSTHFQEYKCQQIIETSAQVLLYSHVAGHCLYKILQACWTQESVSEHCFVTLDTDYSMGL